MRLQLGTKQRLQLGASRDHLGLLHQQWDRERCFALPVQLSACSPANYEAMADRLCMQVVEERLRTQPMERRLHHTGQYLRYLYLASVRGAPVVARHVGKANRGLQWVQWIDRRVLRHIAHRCR